jgi:hypothetical protein
MPISEVIITVLLNSRLLISVLCRATTQAVSRQIPTSATWVRAQLHVLYMWTVWYWSRLSLSTSVSTVNSYCTDYSTLIISRQGELIVDIQSGRGHTPH